MSVIVRKVRTLRRVIEKQGLGGVAWEVGDRISKAAKPPLDYLRAMPSAVSLLARHGRPAMMINAVGAGIGDDLLCSAILRELRLRGRDGVWIRSRNASLHRGNGDVSVIVPPLERYERLMARLGVEVVTPWYTGYNPAFDRDEPMPQQHIISIMCQKAGITGSVSLRPYLSLTESERAGRRVERPQVAIQSSGLDAKYAMITKNWFPDRYQAVVDALSGDVEFVQLGSRSDPELRGALDMRGMTSLRESGAILARSHLFIGQVGLLMHLARAVDCRSVIVYGGRERPEQTGYVCNENLHTPIACSPCWRLNSCPYDVECLREVAAADVIAAARRQLTRVGTPLDCEVATITEELIQHNAARHAEAAERHLRGWKLLWE